MEEKKINKIFKLDNILLIISIALLIIAILTITIPVFMENKGKAESKTLHDLIYTDQDHQGEYAKINLAYAPYEFAVQEESFKYYFAMDKDGYMYIIRLTDETYDKLVKLQEEKQSEFSYELQGYIYEIPQELKKIAIESYNEISEKTILTEENLEEYIGSVYLDETRSPSKTYIAIIVGGLIAIIAVIIIMILKYKNGRKLCKEY